MEKQKSLGALWTKTSASGKVYYSGNLELDGKKMYIVGFKNENKTNENQPDISIYESKPLEKKEEVKKELPSVQQYQEDNKEVPF